MKKLLLICSILMASCHFGEVEGIPEATKLTLVNNSTKILYDVTWNGTKFGDIEEGEKISMMVTPIDKAGGAPIIFKTVYGMTYQVRQPLSCKSLEHKTFSFTNETQVKTNSKEPESLKDI